MKKFEVNAPYITHGTFIVEADNEDTVRELVATRCSASVEVLSNVGGTLSEFDRWLKLDIKSIVECDEYDGIKRYSEGNWLEMEEQFPDELKILIKRLRAL